MSTTTEIADPFAEAVAEAMAEMGEATPTDPPTDEPLDGIEAEAEGDEAEETEGEQSETELEPPADEDPEEDDELFGDLEVPEIEEEPQEAPADSDSHVLPGIDEPVSTEELRNGYLRQQDYTRKTQEVAAEKKVNAKAVDFWQALTSRPHDVAQQLAVAAGLIEEGDSPVKVVELPFTSEEEINTEVERRVAEALADHPDVLEAQRVAAEQWLESEFARIEQVYDTKLGPKSRELILKTAHAKQVDDLEMVFQALQAKQQEQARKRASLKAASPAKPSGKATPQAVTEEPDSFMEAAAQAAAELGINI